MPNDRVAVNAASTNPQPTTHHIQMQIQMESVVKCAMVNIYYIRLRKGQDKRKVLKKGPGIGNELFVRAR